MDLIVIFDAIVAATATLQIFPLAAIPFRPNTSSNNVDERFIFKVCSTVLETTEWKYVSMIIFDTKQVELSNQFLKNFHSEVSSVIIAQSEIKEPAGRVALLIYGNVRKLLRTLKRPSALWVPHVSYIILTPKFPKDSEKIFEDLWKNHHVNHVLFVAFKNVGKIRSYNPFFKTSIEDVLQRSNFNATIYNIRKIMRQKMTNLNGYPIRVTMFPTRLKAVPQEDGTFAGSDGIILQILAKRMNFTPVINAPRDGHKYGWKEKDGTFTGAIGEVVHGHADIAFNGVFIKHYHSNDIQFTTPVHFDQVCFVVPKASIKPKWKTVFLTFDLSIWLSVLVAYWVVLLAWYALKKLDATHFDGPLVCLNLYGIFLMMSVNRIRSNWWERTIVLTTVLFAFVVASSFQGSMIKFLTYETYEHDLRRIEELDKAELDIMSGSLNLKELFETDENPIMSKLLVKFSWNEKKDILGEIVTKKKAAAIGRKSDMEAKIATSYVKDNQILLHIMEECPRSYHIAYLVPKKSPYVAAFNDVINYLVEAGITKSRFIHSKPFRPLSDYHTSVQQSQSAVVLTIENVIIAFMFLASGFVFSTVVFVFEFVVNVYNRKDRKEEGRGGLEIDYLRKNARTTNRLSKLRVYVQ